jgi:hypothetical protein
MEIFLSIALVMSMVYNIIQALMLDQADKAIREMTSPF